jgi:hypothetical protein
MPRALAIWVLRRVLDAIPVGAALARLASHNLSFMTPADWVGVHLKWTLLDDQMAELTPEECCDAVLVHRVGEVGANVAGVQSTGEVKHRCARYARTRG